MAETSARWLTVGEQAAWRALLEATRLLSDALERDLRRAADMSHADYEILVRLSEAPGRSIRMGDLAGRTSFSPSRLSHAADRLVRVGWLRRDRFPGDGRGSVAVLTDAGFSALERAAPFHVASVRRHLFDCLSQEQVGDLHLAALAVTERFDRHGFPPAGCGPDPASGQELGCAGPDGCSDRGG